MKKLYDIVATTGKYTDAQGNEKPKYQNMGVVLEDDKGHLKMKLESLPVDFNGWANFYPAKNPERAAEVKQQVEGYREDYGF